MTYNWVDVQSGQIADPAAVNALGTAVEAHDAALLPLFPPILALKPADESVTSSTTRQDDDHLFVPGVANAVYSIDVLVLYTGVAGTAGTESGLWIDWTFPTGTGRALYHGDIGVAQGINNDTGTAHITNWVAYQSTTSPSVAIAHGTANVNIMFVRITATWVVGATAGNLRMRWSQTNSNVTPTTVKAGSRMRGDRIT